MIQRTESFTPLFLPDQLASVAMKDIAITPCSLIDAPDVRAQLLDLVDDTVTRTGISPLSEQFLLGLSDARLGHQHILAMGDDQILGMLAVDAAPEVPVAELVVRGEGRREAEVLINAVGDGPIDVWAHGASPVSELPSARKVRELLVMSLGTPLPEMAAPKGMQVLTLTQSREQWGARADEELLRVNNEAFSWHPEQGGWDMARWERAQEAAWFDPDGVFLLWITPENATAHPDAEQSTRLAGFHWTKCSSSQLVNNGGMVGEVYVIGLASEVQGKGVGKFLTTVGVDRLRQSGCEQVILYVEADNVPAVKVYERLGFAVTESHALYRFSKLH